jgi:hypothetical protein
MLERTILRIRDSLRGGNAGIGHLKLAVTGQGRTIWANLTKLDAEPSLGGGRLDEMPGATLLVNARVRMEPAELESIVRSAVSGAAADVGVEAEFMDLQCFSPAYPDPPYLMREV